MKYDASAPDWPDRDRFVLSAGHASMLLYSMLYLTGFGLELDDIKQFRQWGSRTPGHPEYRHTHGRRGHDRPARPGLRERGRHGDRREAPPRALRRRAVRPPRLRHLQRRRPHGGHQPRGRVARRALRARPPRVRLRRQPHHDRRPTELAYSDDVPKRFEAYGWHVVQLGEVANDLDALEAGLRDGMAEETRPTLVVLRSHIGYPSPKFTDTEKAHGNPLGADEVARGQGDPRAARPRTSSCPTTCCACTARPGARGAAARTAWEARRRSPTSSRRALERRAVCTAGSRSCRPGRPARSVRDPHRDRGGAERGRRRRARLVHRRRATSPATPA